MKNITIHIPKDIKLRTSDNAWVSYSRSTTQSQEEEDLNWVIKRVRSILNKLTPENFNALQNQMENITIDTEEKLTGVTDLVFEKVMVFIRFTLLVQYQEYGDSVAPIFFCFFFPINQVYLLTLEIGMSNSDISPS